MRLFLLPISTRRSLVYCDARSATIQKAPSILDRITTKATSTWSTWERAEGGWKRTVTRYGNSVLRRIPYEEWGLKSIPLLTAKRRLEIEGLKAKPVEVVFPSAFLLEHKLADTLHTLATERQPLHRKRMYGSLIGAPLTLPFALVPIIPNIPGFYLLFRGYSHWKALMGARHLEWLVQNKLIRPTPSSRLDQLYAAGLLHQSRDKSKAADPTKEEVLQIADTVEQQLSDGAEELMLLKGWNGKLLAEEFKLPEMEIEIERAVEQVEKMVLEPAQPE